MSLGKLFVVATPIGNLSDISERAIETLKSVNLIAAEDTRRTIKLLNYLSIKTPIISYHKFNENDRTQELVSRMLQSNINVALVSDAGTPCISDPGCILVSMARKEGIEVVAIPGASATTAALSVCGFVFDRFTFLGFVPRSKKQKEDYYNLILSSDVSTFILYESPKRIVTMLKEILVIFPDSNVFIINDITKFYEKSYWGSISDVLNQLEIEPNSNLGEYTIILQKEKNQVISIEPEEKLITIEAMLVNEMICSNCSIKEAITIINIKNSNLSKNQLYKASLNLKKLF